MATPGWEESKLKDGSATVKLDSWSHFYQYIHSELVNFTSFVFRGQRCAWPLRSSIDRLEDRVDDVNRKNLLRDFQSACRGRRGPNPAQYDGDAGGENEWWALGQHFGLPTPLLDFTTSPFVAAFFAFVDEDGPKQDNRRVVYALDEDGVAAASATLEDDRIEFVRPYTDENQRLINQSGLFAKLPAGCNLEEWVRSHFAGESRRYHLIKITIPNRERLEVLRDLNRMNINHLTLFPDLSGAAQFCRSGLVIRDY